MRLLVRPSNFNRISRQVFDRIAPIAIPNWLRVIGFDVSFLQPAYNLAERLLFTFNRPAACLIQK